MPTNPEAALKELGLDLPPPAKPVAAYIPSRRVGAILYVSGQIPILPACADQPAHLLHAGIVPSQVSVEQAQACARQCVLNALAVLKAEAGSLDRLKQVVRLGCFVACEPTFTDQPKVANAASELLARVFGAPGQHARAAVGAPSLPLNAPVEIEFMFELAE
ncbi:MAG: RidA family protein [Phycisphaerae bacterium]|nr:RidA family protein [Phycisphaerae bacterium]